MLISSRTASDPREAVSELELNQRPSAVNRDTTITRRPRNQLAPETRYRVSRYVLSELIKYHARARMAREACRVVAIRTR